MSNQSGARLRRYYRSVTVLVIGATLVAAALAFWTARDWAGSRARAELQGTAAESLALQVEALDGVMEKYRLVPPLLGRRADIRALFVDPQAHTEQLVEILLSVTAASGAHEAVFATPSGEVLASARGLVDDETIMRSGLPEIAAQRRLGRAVLRLADGSRAYAFAAHVPDPRDESPAGIVVIMVPFGKIEASWSLSSNPIFVTDRRQSVILANRQAWVGRTWESPAAPQAPEVISTAEGEFVRLPEAGNGLFVEAVRDIPIMGWTLHVLVDAAPVASSRYTAGWLAALAAVLVGMAALFLIKRQEMFDMRARREKAQNMRLERLVRDRTAELSSVNAALRNEVETRRQTEQRLRSMQDELVHTAKLAVIGQMSATLSHEYNQPLAAIRTYADNATKMIERGKTGLVPDALARIGQMVDRMSALSKTLLSFSRKPGTMLQPVTVESAVSEALVLVGQKARKAGVRIETDIDPSVVAFTGRIRLSQVVVNLVGNAVDALTGEEDHAPPGAKVTIAAADTGEHVRIEIADNGPGIDAEIGTRIFEPFFTTKPVGSGLGLGLSIVDNIVRDLEGSIRYEPVEEGGARFVIELPASQPQAEAAE